MSPKLLYLIVPLAPLLGAIIAGLFGWAIGRAGAHRVTIVGMVVSTVASAVVFRDVLDGTHGQRHRSTPGSPPATSSFEIGFLIDRLSATMMLVVTFVSLMVHIYTIGYMADDPGLPALLLLHLALHVLDADAGDGEQLPAALLRLGGGGPGFLPADRLLVHAPDGDLREPEGVPGEPGRRLRLPARHRARADVFRHARLRGGLRQRAARSPATRSRSSRAPRGR